ncbi:MAG TPA: homocysteine S-methyltransferase family protein, partial [Candidatus Paceibacterota bacterium]
MTFRERLTQGILLFDGAMGTMIIAQNLPDADYDGHPGCSEILNVTRPDVIRSIHEQYLDAGSDVIETNSFGSNEIVFAEYGIPERAREISRTAAQLARGCADRYATPEKPRYVAGSVGPGTKLISLGQTDWAAMHHSYCEQMRGLIEGGVDCILIETCQDMLQIKCALAAANDLMAETGEDVPLIVSVTVETNGTLLLGSELAAVIAVLEPYDICALGINCATGPFDMKPYVRQISRSWKGELLVQPNAGLPRNIEGHLEYTLTADEYVNVMRSFIVEDGVRIVGGCCGTTPGFIRALSAAIIPLTVASRTVEFSPSIASLFSAQTLHQDPAPFFIGERTNTNGSKLFRDALLAENWEMVLDIACGQVISGAHALDLCVAYTGRNEVRDMREAVRRFATQITLPLVIDSTDIAVMEAALALYGGRAVINSA